MDSCHPPLPALVLGGVLVGGNVVGLCRAVGWCRGAVFAMRRCRVMSVGVVLCPDVFKHRVVSCVAVSCHAVDEEDEEADDDDSQCNDSRHRK